MGLDIDYDDRTTKYEKAKIIGSRALQLSQNAPILIDLDEEELDELDHDPVEIAKREYEAGELPLKAERVLPHESGRMY